MTKSEIAIAVLAALVVVSCALMALSNRRKDRRRVAAEEADAARSVATAAEAERARLDAERRKRLAEAHARVVNVIRLRVEADQREAAAAVAEWHARSSARVTAGEISALDPARRFETVAEAGGVN